MRKVRVLFLLILLIPVCSLIGLLLYNPPHHFSTGYINTIVDETGTYALTFQNKDGLFVEPSIDIIYNTVATYFYLNGSTPFYFADLNRSSISYFALTRQNFDGGFSDFAGAGNMLSTFGAIKTVNWTAPQELDNNPSRINMMYTFLNASQNSDGGYNLRPPAEFDFEVGYGIPFSNLTRYTATIEYTHEAIEALLISNLSPPNADKTINFVNQTSEGCRRELGFAAGYAATKSTLFPDLHSTYHGVASLIELGVSREEINKPFSNVSLFIELCYNSLEGGFARYPGNLSDITSTYYGVAALDMLEFDYSKSLLVNKTKILNFITTSQNIDGGFGSRNGTISTFQSAHHAVAALYLLNASLPAENRTVLYNWLEQYKAQNGLYGEIVVLAQYWGVKSAFASWKESSLNMSSLVTFLEMCQNEKEGGFGPIPKSNSTVVDTYAAVESLTLINQISQVNTTAAILWLQNLQTEVGGFASQINLEAFLQSYAPMYAPIAEFILNENNPSMEATFFALAALYRLNAQPLNRSSLRLWLLSSQYTDGGFPYSPGIRSDAVSTYYAVQSLKFINEKPYSSTTCIEFLKGCQMSDGGFSFYPLIGEYFNFSYLFISFTASKALYLLRTQPNDVFAAMDWFVTCRDSYTMGFGDTSYFGSDLRNTPYVMDIVRELNIDRSFDPASWVHVVIWFLIIEIAALGMFGVVKIMKKYRKGVISGIGRTHPNIEEYPAVFVKGLTIKAGKKVILEDVSMTLQDGEVLGVIGESGAGKSTFIKCVLGTKDSSGDIRIYGFNIRKEKKRLQPLIGYVPQDLSKIYENFTVAENLLHFGRQYGLSEMEIIKRGGEILQNLGISEKKESLVSTLSGGQRRRASIAIAMIHQPKLFVLDEPTSGLDPIIREQLWITLLDLAERYNTTLIVITHYPEESKFCTRVAIFGRKRGLIDFGPPGELISNLPGSGRAVDIILKEQIEKVSVNLLPLLRKIPQIEFALEEKRGTHYRVFTNLPVKQLQELLVQALGTQLIELKQTEATLVDYFRIKSLEVSN